MEQKYNKCHLHQYACINKRDKHVALYVSTFHSSKLVCDTDVIGLFSALLQWLDMVLYSSYYKL